MTRPRSIRLHLPISSLLLLLAVAAPVGDPAAAGDRLRYDTYDTDGDGTIDISLPIGDDRSFPIDDRNGDGTLELAGPRAAAPPRHLAVTLPQVDFELVWDSGTTLTNVLGLEAGDADLDGIFDFCGSHFSPNLVYLFEADGQGSYSEIWNSVGNSPPGSYVDFAFGDTDGDGLGEIFAAEVSTLGKVMLFEESGTGFAFVHDTIRESDFTGGRRPRKVFLSDTNGNGREEVIVVTGGSSPTSGLVSIWEHSGAVGENLYSRIFEYTTVSYVFSGAIGDSDNDSRPEIVLGLGGFGGFPINIRRIEYDPGLGTWVHTLFESDVIGLPTAPHVADLDEDGQDELAYGSSGFVTIFESTGVNSYTHRFTTSETLGGNIMSVASRHLSVPGSMSFTAGSFDGDLAVWSYDSVAESWEQTYGAPLIGGPIRGLAMADDGEDGFEEILTGISSVNQVRVYRRIPIATDVATGAPPSPTNIGLAAAPNPFSRVTRLSSDRPVTTLTIYDMSGRMVRRLRAPGGSTLWDARDQAGRVVPGGVYWVCSDGARASLPLVVTR